MVSPVALSFTTTVPQFSSVISSSGPAVASVTSTFTLRSPRRYSMLQYLRAGAEAMMLPSASQATSDEKLPVSSKSIVWIVFRAGAWESWSRNSSVA